MSSTESDLEVQAKEAPAPEVHETMDGGYGWVIVFCSFLFLFSTWGVNSAFAIYFAEYLRNGTFEGASRIDYSYIGGISFGVGLFSGPLINYVHGLIGTHCTILLGNCFQFAAMMLASFSTKLWQLYLTQGLLQSYGLAFVSLPAIPLVSPWFEKRRVLASGLAVMGSGAGGVVFTMGMYKVMEVRSVAWALRAQAIISASLILIGVLLVRTRKKAHIFTPFDLATVKCFGFWVLCFYYITCIFGYVVVLYSLASVAASLGYSLHQGAVVATMVQVGFCYGRPLAGYFSDKLGPITVAAFCYYMSSIFTLAMLIPARNYATLIMLGLLEGSFMGAIFPTTAPITIRLVGLHKLHVSFCMLWMFVGAAAVFSEPIATSITTFENGVAVVGGYTNPGIFAGCSFFACATAAMVLRGYVVGRDAVMARSGLDPATTDVLSVSVPAGDIVRNIISWPSRRA
jgi:MFS family permease